MRLELCYYALLEYCVFVFFNFSSSLRTCSIVKLEVSYRKTLQTKDEFTQTFQYLLLHSADLSVDLSFDERMILPIFLCDMLYTSTIMHCL